MFNMIQKASKATLIGLAGLMTFLGIQVADSNIALFVRHQHKVQAMSSSYLSRVSERAARERNLTLLAYDVNYGNDSSYDASALESSLKDAFKALGINVEVAYKLVEPPQISEKKLHDWEENVQDLNRQMPAESLESLVIMPGLKSEREKLYGQEEHYAWLAYNAPVSGEMPEKELEQGLVDFLGQDFYSLQYPPSDVIALVIADFKDGIPGAARFQDGTFFRNYILIDKKIKGKQISQGMLNTITTHEVGHQVGLHHSSIFLDIMSYSDVICDILGRFPGLSFGPESRQEWHSIKEDYAKQSDYFYMNGQRISRKSGFAISACEFTPALEFSEISQFQKKLKQ
jgi:hypothetical protein